MATDRFVIFTGMWPEADTAPQAFPEIDPDDLIVCADGGYIVCVAAGVKPDVVIGDFDSLPAELIQEIDSRGIERLVYPSEKSDTDTMLCVKYGIEHGAENFLIVGGIGGDFGHTIANIQALSYLEDMGRRAEIVTAGERLFMIGGETEPDVREGGHAAHVTFQGRPGMRFSVFSYTEKSLGVSIANAKYELVDAGLTQSDPIGVSNEFINAAPVTVSVRLGRLLVVTER